MTDWPAIRGVLFDLDGTLLDTAPDLIAAANHALEVAGSPACPDAVLTPLISRGAAAMLARGLGDPGKLNHECLDWMLDYYAAHIAVQTRFFDGMERLLHELDQMAVPWGIVTNKLTRFTEPLLAALGLDVRAGCVISGDTTAERKPHPRPLLEAAHRLGVAPGNCVYVGDSRTDMEAGRRAGMRTLAATYGYLAPDDLPEDWPADELIDTPWTVTRWICRDNADSGGCR